MNELGNDMLLCFCNDYDRTAFRLYLVLMRYMENRKRRITRPNPIFRHSLRTSRLSVCQPTELYLINKSKRANLKLGKILRQKRGKINPKSEEMFDILFITT